MKYLKHCAFVCALTAPLAAAHAGQPTGETMGHTCAACHGTLGNTTNEAFVPLAGMDRESFIRSMLAYKNLMRPSSIMSHIADGYSKEDIERMADFFSKQPKPAPQPHLVPEDGTRKGGAK